VFELYSFHSKDLVTSQLRCVVQVQAAIVIFSIYFEFISLSHAVKFVH